MTAMVWYVEFEFVLAFVIASLISTELSAASVAFVDSCWSVRRMPELSWLEPHLRGANLWIWMIVECVLERRLVGKVMNGCYSKRDVER